MRKTRFQWGKFKLEMPAEITLSLLFRLFLLIHKSDG